MEFLTELVNIENLTPYKNNAKKHPQQQIDNIAKSIIDYGWQQPIVADKNGVIIIGHGRWMAAKQLGIEKVPVHYAIDLTKEQTKKLRLLDNKLNESEWDFDLLKIDMEGLDFSDMSLNWGIEEEITDTEIVEDEVPAVNNQDPPRTQKGDIWVLGNHRLMCGDSTDKADVEKLMNGEKADLLLTDPPYGVSYTDKNEFLNELDSAKRLTNPIENDSHSPEEMKEFWDKCFKLAYEFSKPTMSYYITAPQGGDLLLLLLSVRDCGFALKHQLIWNKNNHVLGRCDYNYKHEPIIYGWKIKGTHNFYGNGEFKTSVWDIPKPLKNDLHPTMKPVALMANAISNSTKEKDIVLDLFCGSGTTIIACDQLNRQGYCMELDPKYCDVIIKRWEQLTGKVAVKE